MRDREEIVEEMSELREDLAHNVEALREAVVEKLDVRAYADRALERTREQVRARPVQAVVAGLALGLFFGWR